eukprot:TRINITY_DN6749_c0_g1_i15.p1 TRINITY_DN6749_c0_g1~~TRINITY_DN6749_c0_g1_i15.p1  ORF type:complete len:141 (+),score=10.90 TRINITY_DN6749_c0_g1_i15:35-457(+)
MKTAQNMLVVSALVVALSFSQPAKAATSEAEVTVLQGLEDNWGLARGTLVCNTSRVTCSTDGDVTRLDLSGNSLTGSIPESLGTESLGSLTNLSQLYLYSNNLTGSIPNSLGALSNLDVLLLNENKLSGSIPNSLGGEPG